VLLRNANSLSNLLEYPVWLVTGLLVSLSLLPGWSRPLSWVLAPTWGIRGMREAALGGDPAIPVAICLGLGLVYLVIGHFTLGYFEVRARRSATLALTKKGKTLFKTRVGVGKASTPTPAGHFWVREKLRFKDAPAYGNHALGTAAYAKLSDWPGGGVVGIHGTDQPNLIPGRPSHGCVRVPNADMAKLYELTPVGTPIEIR